MNSNNHLWNRLFVIRKFEELIKQRNDGLVVGEGVSELKQGIA